MIVNRDRRFLFIRVPRTASGTLKTALLGIDGSEEIGHHREARTIPDEFTGYQVFGMVRNPIARLHSLWRYCALEMRTPTPYRQAIRDEAQSMDFDSWLRFSRFSFTGGNDGTPFEVAIPDHEADKGQGAYLYSHPRIKPEVFRYEDLPLCLEAIARIVGEPLRLDRHKNSIRQDGTRKPFMPRISGPALTRLIKGDRAVIAGFYPEILQQAA